MALLTIEGASSSSSTHQWEYDVFLNFRGKDTRDNFTSHLHQALDVQGFKTFIDDNLPRGEEISVELLKTIRSSMIWIVVFSKDYASSHWCLDELVEIYKCRSEDRKIIPIFYKVSPSEIREPDGEFGIALDNHEDKFKDKVQTWRETLAKVADLSGFTYKDGYNESESKFIQRVIKEISRTKSNHEPLFVAKHLVGIDIRAEAVELLLDMESNDVCMVGICGIGGIGKTTISKAVYNRIAHYFEGSCFLENLREMSKIIGGITQLQETLLSKILRDRDLKVHNVFEGINLIKKRLHGKKVLLILDDVENSKEVENLLGECNWFASGSRVIITTRDKHVLTTFEIDTRIYEVTELSQCEALELFKRHAFQTSKYGEDFLKLAEQITSYADGLPLALEIIGSDLRGKNIHRWESALEKYKNIPHKDIQKILKISYDGLENFEKEIFLDIACFFKGYNKDDVANILDSCDLYPNYGIEKLIDKCLVTMEFGCARWYNPLSMHDLVQQMGREIVQQESEELEQRSRIWRYKDAHKLLTRNMGSNKIRGIMLCSPKPTKIALEANVFKRMKNLKFLIGNVHIAEALEYLPDELRFLEWREFPLSLSSKCCHPRQLVVLKMYKSNNILENVVKQPDYFPVLASLDLSRMDIVTIPESISRFTTLEHLEIEDCKKLRKIPRLPQSIRTVNAQYCYRLNTQSSSRLLNQFLEILGFLPNTIAKAATNVFEGFLLLPAIEIPKWFEFNHHQSVGNSVSFLVGPEFSYLAVCIAIPSKDIVDYPNVRVFINGKERITRLIRWANGSRDHVWLMSWKVDISNPSEENLIEVKVTSKFSVRMWIFGECICCLQKPNISPASSMDQCAFNNGEEDSGRVGIPHRLPRRNHIPNHARRPQKHYLSRFGWLRIQYRLWKPSSKPWRRRITNGFHDQGSSSIPNTLSMMIPRPILLHRLNPTLRRR